MNAETPTTRTNQDRKKLSARAERFCQRFVLHLNGTRAAIEAGYREHSARKTASDLRTDPRVQERIRQLLPIADAEVADRKAKRRTSCHVYAVQNERTNAIKVGIAGDPLNRLKELQIGSSDPLRLLGVTAGNRAVEKQLHRRFRGSRIAGEWFRPTREILEWVDTLSSESPSPEPLPESVPPREKTGRPGRPRKPIAGPGQLSLRIGGES